MRISKFGAFPVRQSQSQAMKITRDPQTSPSSDDTESSTGIHFMKEKTWKRMN
jgi:hypothetical protein